MKTPVDTRELATHVAKTMRCVENGPTIDAKIATSVWNDPSIDGREAVCRTKTMAAQTNALTLCENGIVRDVNMAPTRDDLLPTDGEIAPLVRKLMTSPEKNTCLARRYPDRVNGRVD